MSLKQEIVQEVGQNLYLQDAVVKQVIDEFLRILRREIINRGEATLKGLFTIKTSKKKAHTRKHIVTGEDTEFEESEFLTVSLSKPLRDEFQRSRNEENPRKNSSVAKKNENPFLDDDYV